MQADDFARDVLADFGIRDERADLSFLDFRRKLWSDYEHAAHLAAMDGVLDDITRWLMTDGREGWGRWMVFMPPRHGKSETISRMYPAWLLARLPWLRIIIASYSTDLAYKHSRRVRNMLASGRYRALYPHIALSDTRAAVKEWDLAGEMPGGMNAVGVGSGVTGFGANLIIIDDPVKNRMEAESPRFRQRAKDWYTNDLRTRLEKPGAMLVVMTRWHEDDLAGWLLASNDESWRVLRLPALAEADDPLGRAPGEALWRARFDEAALEMMRTTMGEYAFAGLYQQSPLPLQGRLFEADKIEIVDYEPALLRAVRFYDLAVTRGKQSDYTVGAKVGLTHDNRPIILDIRRVQRELPDVQELIVQTAQMDGQGVPVRLEAEKAGIVQLQFLLRDARMNGFALDAEPPQGDKFTRAAPFAARVNSGRVLMLRGTWNAALLDELSVFPVGAHDDQVDALSGAWDMLSNDGMTIGRMSAEIFNWRGW